MSDKPESCFPNQPFKTVDELRSLREEKGNRSPEQLKVSATNRLYYKACPIDDVSLDKILHFIDNFTEERESRNRVWLAEGLEKYTKCTYKTDEDQTADKTSLSDDSQSTKIRPLLKCPDLAAAYRQSEKGGSNATYVDDVLMENLLRARMDGVKEKLRIQKYKKHMKQFLKVYQILKGGGLDYADALKILNAPSVREAYICGLKTFDSSSFWKLSTQSLPIRMETFAVNRRRLLRELSKNYGKAVIVLKGGEETYLYDTCEKQPFRQESFFLWLFGATEPNLWGCIDCWTGKTILLIDRTAENDEELTTRQGYSVLKRLQDKYEVNHVCYIDEIEQVVSQMNPSVVLTLNQLISNPSHSYQSLHINNLFKIEVNSDVLYGIMSDLRVIKTQFELDLIRYANNISSLAHRLLMKRITADSYEYQAEALFKFFAHFVGNCSDLSYAPMCASGSNSSDTEHKNNVRLINCEDLVIFDMGASFYGYTSSIACTIPAGGLFNLEQKTIYSIVLDTRKAALDVIKAGVFWTEVHEHAMSVFVSGLKNIGLLSGEVKEMLQAGVSAVFMPYGIGYLTGLDRFDVGGFTEEAPKRSTSTLLLSQLRTHRMLKPGMVLTVQVGCYFRRNEIVKASSCSLLKQFIVKEKVNRFLGMGGVYIKDSIAVTHQGYEILTDVPRTVAEIEDWLGGKYTDNFNAFFEQQSKLEKDELWLGSKRNPCIDDNVNNRI